jgi:hypothetical protein
VILELGVFQLISKTQISAVVNRIFEFLELYESSGEIISSVGPNKSFSAILILPSHVGVLVDSDSFVLDAPLVSVLQNRD